MRTDAEAMRPYTVSHLFRDCEALDGNRKEVWQQALGIARQAGISSRNAVEEADRELWYTLAMGEAVSPAFVDIGAKRWYKWNLDKTAGRSGQAPHLHAAYQELMSTLARHLVYAVERLQVRIMDTFAYTPPPDAQRPTRLPEDGPAPHRQPGRQQPPGTASESVTLAGGAIVGGGSSHPEQQPTADAATRYVNQSSSRHRKHQREEGVGAGEDRIRRLGGAGPTDTGTAGTQSDGPMHRFLRHRVVNDGGVRPGGGTGTCVVSISSSQQRDSRSGAVVRVTVGDGHGGLGDRGGQRQQARMRGPGATAGPAGPMLSFLRRFQLESGAQAPSNQRSEAYLAGIGTQLHPVEISSSSDDSDPDAVGECESPASDDSEVIELQMEPDDLDSDPELMEAPGSGRKRPRVGSDSHGK